MTQPKVKFDHPAHETLHSLRTYFVGRYPEIRETDHSVTYAGPGGSDLTIRANAPEPTAPQGTLSWTAGERGGEAPGRVDPILLAVRLVSEGLITRRI